MVASSHHSFIKGLNGRILMTTLASKAEHTIETIIVQVEMLILRIHIDIMTIVNMTSRGNNFIDNRKMPIMNINRNKRNSSRVRERAGTKDIMIVKKKHIKTSSIRLRLSTRTGKMKGKHQMVKIIIILIINLLRKFSRNCI
jgi:hypothetical protein